MIEPTEEQPLLPEDAANEPESSPRRWYHSFLRGLGSVLEIFPSGEGLDRWRISRDPSIDEWPAIARTALEELQVDTAEKQEPPT